MFEHHLFDVRAFEDVPLNQDLFLMDEIWLGDYERAWLKTFSRSDGDPYSVGYISYAAARSNTPNSIELSWYPNIYDRFHELLISLPRDQFIICVGCHEYDEKPHIFVKSDWLRRLHLQTYSAFALFDAIGVKVALSNGSLTRTKLEKLRNQIDLIASCNKEISFISLADSLLLKSQWSVGQYDSEVKYNYRPEALIHLIPEIESAYRNILGLKIYAVLTQGSNAYYQDSLLHISESQNHISLNSLGLPFAQLLSIDTAVREAISKKLHPPADLYMDEKFFYSLRLNHEFKHSCGTNIYREPMANSECEYVYANYKEVLGYLNGKE